jgi:CheY-like chemotaxis protein
MPKMDGLQATQAVLQQLSTTKIILVSRNDPVVVRQQAAQVRDHAFVGKEALFSELKNMIGLRACAYAESNSCVSSST